LGGLSRAIERLSWGYIRTCLEYLSCTLFLHATSVDSPYVVRIERWRRKFGELLPFFLALNIPD